MTASAAVALVALLAAGVALTALLQSAGKPPGRRSDGGDSEGGGGGSDRVAPRFPRGSGSPPEWPEPDWWPEFEQDFARYAGTRSQARENRDPLAP